MTETREIRCRHCDAARSLAGYVDARFIVEVGDGAPRLDLTMDGTPFMNCDLCGNDGEWHEMGYIWYPGITESEKDEQKECWA